MDDTHTCCIRYDIEPVCQGYHLLSALFTNQYALMCYIIVI